MNTYTVVLRKDRLNKNGQAPILFVATLNREQVKLSTGITVNPKDWCAVSCTILKNTNNDLAIIKLNEIIAKADRYKYLLLLDSLCVSPSDFVKHVFEQKKEHLRHCFYSLATEIFETKNVCHERTEHYNVFIKQLRLYAPKLKVQEVNYSFCVKYFNWLELKYNNSANTKIQKLKILGLILNEAVRRGDITKNTITDYKIKGTKGKRTALTKEELQVIETKYIVNDLVPHLQNTLQCFLFMCYTGMRYSDMKKFSLTDVENNVIKIQQGKTQSWVHIPLLPQAQKLLANSELKVLSGQKLNQNLKTIVQSLNLTKAITCHIARHTFATIGLNTGVPLEVVSEVLGHKSLAVTRIYAKMNDTYKIEQMAKWGQ